MRNPSFDCKNGWNMCPESSGYLNRTEIVKLTFWSTLVKEYSVSLKTLLQQGISEPEFYGDLVYRFRKIVGKSNFSE